MESAAAGQNRPPVDSPAQINQARRDFSGSHFESSAEASRATVNIVWNWGTNSNIAFNPATDILDFGWFAADQFTISEVNGTVVIAIPSNHQTYTLAHTTLSELHLSNIVAKDTSAIAAWQSALASAPIAPPPPPAPPPPA